MKVERDGQIVNVRQFIPSDFDMESEEDQEDSK